MNTKHLIWINTHAPVIGVPKTKRRRRSKLLFQDERQADNEAADQETDSDYQDRLSERARRRKK